MFLQEKCRTLTAKRPWRNCRYGRGPGISLRSVAMNAPSLIHLASGPVRVVISPQAGGSVARFAVERGGALVDLMRPPTEAALAATNARGLASYPLVPFSNRIG